MFVENLTRGDHQHIVDQLKRTSTQDEPTEGGKKKTKRRHGSQLSDNGTPAKRPKQVKVSTYFDKVVDGVSSDWDDLARKLNFTENQIKVIAEMRPDQNRRCREMLWTWRNRDGQAATLQALKKALINIKQKHLAERLEDSSDSSESSDD
ncbi:tumor necrosis factor receptor superfamily member 10B-like [Branchiostoma floridae]|uniref:Tumor necrosis factor receptor superfamily member 10B-like n=1 Tax=Branchiostoma floridae TaxID=7739 RepID=A0A9J7LNA5_BRAFL|nr:tumor necrosis factor receptor superfamily member 10B-like [Branchiostoma floridae]